MGSLYQGFQGVPSCSECSGTGCVQSFYLDHSDQCGGEGPAELCNEYCPVERERQDPCRCTALVSELAEVRESAERFLDRKVLSELPW